MASQTEVDALVTGYVEFAEALQRGVPDESPAMDDAERAYSAVHYAIRREDAPRAWRLVLEVLRRAPDERLGTYAAGPLEDLVRLRGAELVGAVEAEAAADERFRWALGRIWLDTNDLPPDVLVRVVRASGGEIKPLGWPRTAEPPGAAT